MSEELKTPTEPSLPTHQIEKAESIDQRKTFLLTYHFKMSPPKKFKIKAFTSLEALKRADKIPYKYLANRLDDLASYEVELDESSKEKPDKPIKIGFSQTVPKASDEPEIKLDDVPF